MNILTNKLKKIMKKTIFCMMLAMVVSMALGSCGQRTEVSSDADTTAVDTCLVDTVAVDTLLADTVAVD